METLVSAVLGDLISRSISLAVDSCYHRWRKGGGGIDQDALQRLRHLLLRVQVVIEEADRRRVTNRSMLRQLQLMREALYRGYYLLSSSKISHGVMRDNNPQDREASSSHPSPTFALSQFNPAKRLCRAVSARAMPVAKTDAAEAELQEVLAGLERMASDMKELVVFLSCYPPLSREPYSRHMWLENCLFGRQAEQERIVSFLLEPEPVHAGPEHPSVLPVIGRARVGKSTLVEHVCHDDRVRKNFSLIVFLGESDNGDGKLLPLGVGDGGVVKHRDLASPGKALVVIELAGDVDESTWERTLCKLRGQHKVPAVSKIIVTSRSDKIASFGTTAALELKPLPREAFWYYFKTVAFGSTDAEEQPELADVCMEMVDLLNRSILAANHVGNILRANPCSRFWRMVLKCFKEHISMHHRLFGEHPDDLLAEDRPIYLWRFLPNVDGKPVAYRISKACSVQRHDVPRITADELFTTSSPKIRGKFEVVVWISRIPPYYTYLLSCGVQASSTPFCTLPRNKQRKQQQ
ncbi:unnamed protein product [Urochloa humidicola]